MAVAKSNSYIEPSSGLCTCYKVSGLRGTILNPNTTAHLSDKYILGERLGWGQFGIIRECMDKFSGQLLACKSISKDRLVTLEDIKSINLEIEIMTKLSGHPNIVDLKAVYEEEDYVHLVMELCAGGELFNKLEKYGRFSEPEAQVIFRHLMQVVVYCHDKGIVHRDLKPENILLATKSSSSPIKLADFGLATYIRPGQSLLGTVGSPFYIAPEVLAGGYNQAADVWSAGVILYILLSGIPPFWGMTKSRIFDAVRASDLRFPSNQWDFISDSAKDLIKGMLCKDTSTRLTAREVLGHSWLTNIPSLLTDLHRGSEKSCGGQNLLSSSLRSRNQDISFGTGSALISEIQSDSFACKSSFSSFLAAPVISSSGTVEFSFHSNASSSALENSTLVISLPSFAFYGVEPGVAKRQNDALDVQMYSSDVGLIRGGKTKAVGESRELEVVGIGSRRNHTLGASEIQHLVTESVIRWASCTRLPTPTSLKSSLVC